jgi:epoxyqueuosine reductase
LAKEIGFNAIGFAENQILIEESKQLKQWLEMGYNAQMQFFDITFNKRKNISNILQNAKTVIMLAVNYYNNVPFNSDFDFKKEGKIARFAWGVDYHIIIQNMLKQLTHRIKEIDSNAECIAYVDSGPVMEKRWAEKAGIGWQGKNSLIINKEYGSWIFLGIILTSLYIEPDDKATNHCGNCNICIDKCPTSAISEPGIINAQKCISYWTIEDKSGSIPDFVLKNINGWLFGCDICQEVCPWNINANQTNNPDFKKYKFKTLYFDEIMNISDVEYKVKYKDTPLFRRKHKLLKSLVEKLL